MLVEKNKYRLCIVIELIILFIEYKLFKNMYTSDMAIGLPTMTDQIVYIGKSYSIFENIRNGNWWAIRAFFEAAPNGALLVIAGVFSLALNGVSRYSLIVLNFLLMAFTQFFCGWCFYKLSKKESYILLFSGMFLMIDSIYYYAGSIYDYRLDFGLMCLYTCWLMLLVCGEKTNNKKLFYSNAVLAGIIVMFRPIACAYIGLTVIIYEIIICIYEHSWKYFMQEIIRWIKYVAVVVVVSGYYLISNLSDIISYYSVQFYQPEKEIRDIEFGVDNKFTYYFDVILREHLWEGYVYIAIITIVLVCMLFVSKRMSSTIIKQSIKELLLIVSGIFCPWLILTMHVGQTPVVINIISGGFVIFIVYIIMQIDIYGKQSKRIEILKHVVFLCFICLGMIHYSEKVTVKNPTYVNAEQKGASKMMEKISSYLSEQEYRELNVFSVDTNAYYSPLTLQLIHYEKEKEWIEMRDIYETAVPQTGGTAIMLYANEMELQNVLSLSDIVIIAPDDYVENPLYPRDICFNEYREYIYNYANNNMKLLFTQNIDGEKFFVFVNNYRLFSEEDGWYSLKKNGVEVDVSSKRKLILEGKTNEYIEKLSGICYDEEGREIKCDMEYNQSEGIYRITIDLEDLETGKHNLKFRFNQFFCPNDIANNGDVRELVVMKPDNIYYN